MEQLKSISSSLKRAIKENDKDSLNIHVEEFIEFLLGNFMDPRFRDLTKEDREHLELCCLVLEHERFHLNQETDIIFTLDLICKDHPELKLFHGRITSMRYIDKIGNIENDWKDALELCIKHLFTLGTISSSQLSDTGREIFMDRSGIKVMNQLSSMLSRLNLQGQLPTYLTSLLLSSNIDHDLLRKVLQWTTKQNDPTNSLTEDLINI